MKTASRSGVRVIRSAKSSPPSAKVEGCGDAAIMAEDVEPGFLHGTPVALHAALRAGVLAGADMADAAIAEVEQVTGRGMAGAVLREADIDVDRVVGQLHRLNDGNAGAFEHAAGVVALVDAGEDHRLGMQAEHGGDGLLLLRRLVAPVEHHHLEAGRQEGIVQCPQIVGKDAVGERGNEHADGAGVRRGQGAGELVGDVAQRLHGACHARAQVRRDHFRPAQGA